MTTPTSGPKRESAPGRFTDRVATPATGEAHPGLTSESVADRFADRVYDVLVGVCGATDTHDNRAAFKGSWPDCDEYRFQGALGFGGKVWSDHGLRVTCYPEDRTPERVEMIRRANEDLETLGQSLERFYLADSVGEGKKT